MKVAIELDVSHGNIRRVFDGISLFLFLLFCFVLFFKLTHIFISIVE